jgi:hypothetical protein
MITFLPLLNGETGEAQPKSRTKMIEPEMLRGYPRIQSAFTVDEPDGLHKYAHSGRMVAAGGAAGLKRLLRSAARSAA